MASKIKVDNIANQADSNIVNKCGTDITLGASGDTISLAAGASQTGFGRTGTVDWDTTAKTASFTAVSGNGYFVNTTSGAVTVTLPAGSAGDIVSLKDYANTWDTNNVTVTPNGTDKINGNNGSATLNTEDQSVTLVYVDSTKGWRAVQDSTSSVTGATFITATGGTITCCGDYKIHTFTGPGTFTVCSVSCSPSSNIVSYIIVGGGGAGGGASPFGSCAAGGGGAGGFREVKNTDVDTYNASPLNGYCTPANRVTVTAQGYPIIVGGGGTPGISVGQGASGSNSSFGGITGAGGGGGGGATSNNGANGGSGGGKTSGGTAGSGNSPPVSPPQGQNGGSYGPGGGGGGATQAGFGQDSPFNKDGGAGATSSINGTPTARAGGGGGGGGGAPIAGGGAGGSGGTGGGGAGAPSPSGCNSTAGTVNTGGGGGGGPVTDCSTSGAGGSGIVIIRYKFQ